MIPSALAAFLRRLLLAVSPWLPACAHPAARPEGPAERAVVRVEAPGGEIRELPCVLRPGAVDFGGTSFLVGEFTGTDGSGQWQVNYHGVSGAPVLSLAGELLGACSKTWGESAQRTFGITPRGDLDDLLDRGRVLGLRLEAPAAGAAPPEELGDGMQVALLSVWGDVLFGQSGTITLVQGEEILALGHPISVFENRPCLYALFRAPVVAIVPDGRHRVTLTGLGEPVGAITYEGVGGCYGLRRWPIPSVELRCVLLDPSERRLEERRCFAAADPDQWRSNLARAAQVLLGRWLSLQDLGFRLEMSSPSSSRALLVEPGSDPREVRGRVDAAFTEFVRTLEQDAREIEIVIRLDGSPR